MSWHPNDVVSDVDLLAYEQSILTAFGQGSWTDKRHKALEDWIFPRLVAAGFAPATLRTRYEPDTVQGYTSSTYSDQRGAATSATSDDLNLATIFAAPTTPGTDCLYVGSSQVFRGLSARALDAVNSAAAIVTVSYWADAWVPLSIADNTRHVPGMSFSGGGSLVWAVPEDWTTRSLNGSTASYFVKLTFSAVPTGAKIGQLGVIRRSALCAPATFRTLALIMREAPTKAHAGPWTDKADWYEQQAIDSLQLALPMLGGEFDTDASDQISGTESEQTAATVGGGPFVLERL